MKIEKILEEKLFNINNSLDDILMEIVDRDFKTDNHRFQYLLTSIEVINRRIKERIK